MNILIVSTLYYPDHLGGAEISTQILAENLSKDHNFNVTIFSHGKKDKQDTINGIKVIRHYFGIATDIIYSNIEGIHFGAKERFKGKIIDITRNVRLINLYSKLFSKYDLIIVSGNARNMGRRNIWISANNENIPLIQIVRDPVLLFYKNGLPCKPEILDKFFRYFSKKDLEKVPFVVGPTKAILDNHKKYGIKFRNETVIPNIIVVNNPRSYSFENKNDDIIYVGSISKPKGSITLIKAIKKVQKSLPNVRLILVGKNTGIDIPDVDYIVYKGHMEIDDVYEEMARAKLLILPSEWEEAFGRTVVEAVFNGTLAACSDAGGTHELLNDDQEFVFRSGHIDELAELLIHLMQKDKVEYEAALSKQNEYCNRFTLETNIKIWKEYLQNC